jgi:hypothetical protein
MGLEPTIPAFERAKTVHALDHAATVLDLSVINGLKLNLIILLSYSTCISLIRLDIQTRVLRSVKSETTKTVLENRTPKST